MTRLNLAANLARPDDLYEQLVQLHDGLSEPQSLQAYARLVLLLSNHIGDKDIIAQANALARDPRGGAPGGPTPSARPPCRRRYT